MEQQLINQLRNQYSDCLFNDVLPFWLKHAPDREYGGFLTYLDRDGSVYSTDKPVWLLGRTIWMFSKLYNTVEKRPEWLDMAKLGYDFLTKHAFDTDGRLFFMLTRDGRPLRKRRYLFSESFAIIACAEYAKAAGDEEALEHARATYRLMVKLHNTPGALPPKVIPETRVTKSHAMPMILIATTQELRQVDSDPLYQEVMDDALHQILRHFVHRDEHALFETVGPGGERLDSPQGRCINPGHAIESAWFIMHEGRHRNDPDLIRSALEILDWSLDWGWDKEFGGLLYFVDAEGKPTEQYEWDMKLWWPHAEALYALLLAHHLSGDEKYLMWLERMREWAFDHFADPGYGEWFGYLHRDGTVSHYLKGNTWKGPFHVPRTLWLSLRLLDEMNATK